MRGTWQVAAEQARRACAELTSHDPRYAGEAHYLIGDLHRVTGDLDLAEEAFTRAHQLGRPPQPGLAKVRIEQGRAELLVALVEACIAGGDVDGASGAADECAAVATQVPNDDLVAVATGAQAMVCLARGEASEACARAGDAAARFQSLRMPYELARARVVRGAAARMVDEPDTARLELEAAFETFRSLGAESDARRVGGLLGEGGPPSSLSNRETEVLRLVAGGGTNKDIAAELLVSEHTVARHLGTPPGRHRRRGRGPVGPRRGLRNGHRGPPCGRTSRTRGPSRRRPAVTARAGTCRRERPRCSS